MSAYSISIPRTCDAAGCTKMATERVYNTYHTPMGRFCRKHAAARVRALLAGERRRL